MTFRSPFRCLATPLLLLSALLAAASANKYVPASLILNQKSDAQQVLLVQVTASAPAAVLQSECGTDSYYTTSAVVLGVNRTVDPDATALGAQNEGRVMEYCSTLQFRTFERNWIPGCEAYADPGRKAEGACGYAYLTPGMEATDPYAFAVTGDGGFDGVDGGVCRAAAERHCPEYVREDEGGSGPAGGSGDKDEGGNEPASGSGDKGDSGSVAGDGTEGGEGDKGDEGGEGGEGDGAESVKNGTMQSHLSHSVLIGLFSMVAHWRPWV